MLCIAVNHLTQQVKPKIGFLCEIKGFYCLTCSVFDDVVILCNMYLSIERRLKLSPSPGRINKIFSTGQES